MLYFSWEYEIRHRPTVGVLIWKGIKMQKIRIQNIKTAVMFKQICSYLAYYSNDNKLNWIKCVDLNSSRSGTKPITLTITNTELLLEM